MALQSPGGALYPVLPLRDIVVFPHMIVPLFVGREKSVRALEDVMQDDKHILMLTQKSATQDDPVPEDLYTLGTIGTVLQLLKLPDGTVKVLVEGSHRAKVVRFAENPEFFQAFAEPIEEFGGDEGELGALVRAVIGQFDQYIKLNKKIPPEVLVSVNQIDDPAKLADTIASHLTLKIPEKQSLLEITSVNQRLEKIFGYMEGEIGVLQVEKKIRSRVKKQMEKTQRDYYLNEQMKAIQKELGETEEGKNGADELETKINATKMSKEAKEKSLAELKKLRAMSPMSAEATVVRNYLDWMLGIPWNNAPVRAATSRRRRKSSISSITDLKRSKNVFSNILRCNSARIRSRGRSSASSALPASVKLRLANPSPKRPAAISSACRSAAYGMKLKSADIAGPISARCPARSSRA